MRIAIGICARNEEVCIIQTLDSIFVSVSRADASEWRLFVCANGCTDNTINLVKGWQTNHPQVSSELLILKHPNLVDAQREIVTASSKSGITTTLFFDADIIIDPDCIAELLGAAKDSAVKAAYAVSVPLKNKNEGLITMVLNQYDLTPTIFTERKHLHGRAFLIKNWGIPDTRPKLVADDIYLSFSLLKEFGPQSIRRVLSAKVSFGQIVSYDDFYRAYKRRRRELEKCLGLFPEFKSLPKDQINRRVLWGRLLSEPFDRLMLWVFLFSLRIVSSIRYAIEKTSSEQWMPTDTSKRNEGRPLLILLEGLDCSGKKTVARLLQQRFIDAGISCRLNRGSLSSKSYRFLSGIVSMHSFPNPIRSLVYSLEGIGEKKWYKHFFTQTVIQISSPYRNWAYAYCNKSRWRIFISKMIRKNLAHYDFVFYLTTPYKTRVSRHRLQVLRGENPDAVGKRFFGEQKFIEMENILKELVYKENPIEKEFNTASQDAESITDEIFLSVQKLMQLRFKKARQTRCICSHDNLM